MAKVVVKTDADATIYEFYVADEYIQTMVSDVKMKIQSFIIEEERRKLLEEIDATLAERVNEKVRVVVQPE